jgi:hypothetical protein
MVRHVPEEVEREASVPICFGGRQACDFETFTKRR